MAVVVPAPVSLEVLADFEIDDEGRMHMCVVPDYDLLDDYVLYASDTDPWQWQEVDFVNDSRCRLAVKRDGSEVWMAGLSPHVPDDNPKVAHIVDGGVEMHHFTGNGHSTDVALDSQGRPWVVMSRGMDDWALAHLDNNEWIVEPLSML